MCRRNPPAASSHACSAGSRGAQAGPGAAAETSTCSGAGGSQTRRVTRSPHPRFDVRTMIGSVLVKRSTEHLHSRHMTFPEIGGAASRSRRSLPRLLGRLALGAALLLAGISHLTFNREAFQAQVPAWVPLDADLVVVLSGIAEIILGTALLTLHRWRVPVGWVVAAFFVAIFPGNISQFVTATDSFGLNSDLSRGIRLAFQPLLVLWALWATDAWRTWRARRSRVAARPLSHR